MAFDAGSTQVSSAGTAVQLDPNGNRFNYILLKGRLSNTGAVYFGKSDVSSTNGMELQPGEAVPINFGSEVPMDVFYVDAANNNDRLDWAGF